MLHRVQDSTLHNAERLTLRKVQPSALRKVQGWGKGTKKIDHATQQVSDALLVVQGINRELRRHRDNAAHDARVAGLPPQLHLDTQWYSTPTSVVLYGMGTQYAEYTRAIVDKMAVHIEQMIANVRASVLALWPQAQVETFGSYSTSIWLPRSDVDLVILDAAGLSDSKMKAEHLKELAKHYHSLDNTKVIIGWDRSNKVSPKVVSIPHPSGPKVSQTATAARGESSKGRMSVNLFSAAASGLQGLLGLDDDDDDILAQELMFPPPVERGSVRRRGGSRPGKSANKERDYQALYERFMKQYFDDNPVYNDYDFRVRNRMSKNMICRLMRLKTRPGPMPSPIVA
ncbi:unnamed protein product [Phytophthora fragariaefolia]|uniref:Unnamed protein product n=1 Tax=Phytophthora fragariaefolia TaxID=1490495 RepID=A0A9W6Y0S6_9STRA|nr:unnamed protein product [Phytophthora fragariaefolia]